MSAPGARRRREVHILHLCRVESGSRLETTNVSVNASIQGAIHIGDDVIIGPNAVLRTSDHEAEAVDRPMRDQGHVAGVITIESDVWIGANTTIVGGVRVGQGSVVAAGAVVVRDVEPYTIVGGVPARFIKKRGE